MAYKIISRRRFIIENSVSGGLAVGFGLGGESLGATAAAIPGTDELSFKVVGDATHGFGVAILRNGEPIARHNQGGEFSATFQNEDRSAEDHVENWKASAWTGDHTRLALSGEWQVKKLERYRVRSSGI